MQKVAVHAQLALIVTLSAPLLQLRVQRATSAQKVPTKRRLVPEVPTSEDSGCMTHVVAHPALQVIIVHSWVKFPMIRSITCAMLDTIALLAQADQNLSIRRQDHGALLAATVSREHLHLRLATLASTVLM